MHLKYSMGIAHVSQTFIGSISLLLIFLRHLLFTIVAFDKCDLIEFAHWLKLNQ